MTTYPIPQLSVELAFDGPTVHDDDLTWIDVSDHVRRQGIRRTAGRADERASLTDPGTLTVTLDNASGDYTPGSSASPYYPHVLPWRRIRVTLMTSPSRAVFYGFVTSWRLTWDAPSAPVVELTAVDCLALLRRRALRSVLSEEILVDGPVIYYPLGEADGATAAVDLLGGASLQARGVGVAFGAGTGPSADGATAPQFDGDGFLVGPRRSTGSAITVEAFVRVSAAPAVRVFAVNVPYGTGVGYLALVVDSSGYLVVGTGSSTQRVSTNVADGRTHHLAATASAGTISAIYIDGVAQSMSAALLIGDTSTMRVGEIALSPGVTVTVSHVAVYDSQLSAARIAAHYTAGMTGFAGETTVARLTRWAGYVGETVAYTPGHEGAALGHIDTTGRTVLDCIDTALATDHGSVLYSSLAARQLEYTSRTQRYGASSSVTLDCSDDQIDADLTATIDDTRLASSVTVPTGTGSVTVTNADVLATYGEIGMSLDAAPATTEDAQALAEWLAAETATPTPRIAQVSTDLLVMALDSAEFDPTAIPVLGQLVSLVNLPATAPTASLDAFVEGVEESIAVDEWRITANLSPAEPWTKVWTIQGPGDSGKVEAGYVVAL